MGDIPRVSTVLSVPFDKGDSGLPTGDGKCAQCHGTGINTQPNSAQAKCPSCNGTGVCQTCGGRGRPSFPGDVDIQQLFD
jgi:DnaJ-class molecular chaperone